MPPGKKSYGIYYGWFIVLVAFISNFMGSGTAFYIFNAFIEPLCKTRGWTRTEINIAPMLGYVVNLFGVLFFGTIITRTGPRVLMTASACLAALSFLLMGLTSNLFIFYLLFMTLFLGVSGMSGIVTSTAVGNWFVLKRGNALGIATAGVSLAGVILPAVAQAIIHGSGLFYAFFFISLAILTVSPISFAVIRTKPEDYGLLPDGVRHEPGKIYDEEPFHNEAPSLSPPMRGAEYWTFQKLVGNGDFWKIGLAFGLSMTSVLGVMFQLKPRFSDLGFDTATAMRLMAATALLGTLGKYVWAFMCDRFPARKVITLLLFLNAAGLSLGLIPDSITAVVFFILIYGFAMGGVVSTQPVVISEYFGREAYPAVARYVGLIVGINCIGYPIMGRSFDLTGSYNAAYMIFIILNIAAALLMGSLRQRR